MRGTGLLDDAPHVRGSHALDELLGASVSGDACIDRTPLLAGETMLVRGIWTPDDVACVSSAGTVERVRLCRVRCRP